MELKRIGNTLQEFEKIITEYQDRLFRFAFFRTGCSADSQDIVQEVFIKLYRENGHLSAVNNIRNYLYRSIANACTDYLRKRNRLKFEQIDKAFLPESMMQSDISQEMIQKEEFQRLEKMMAELPGEQSEIIRLRVFDDLSFIEISEIFELPVTTVKSRFKYGIDKLKLSIESQKEVCYGL